MSVPVAAIGGGLFGASGTFSTGVNGNATITAVGGAGGIGAYDIADTSNQANWSGKINYMQYPENIIDLSTLKADIIVYSDYYQTDGQKYMFTGDYVFTGDTTKRVVIQNTTADITFKNATMGRLSVGAAGTANVTLVGNSNMDNVTVDSGSKRNTTGSGTLQITMESWIQKSLVLKKVL